MYRLGVGGLLPAASWRRSFLGVRGWGLLRGWERKREMGPGATFQMCPGPEAKPRGSESGRGLCHKPCLEGGTGGRSKFVLT